MRRILTILILIGIVAAAGWTLYRWNGPLTSVKDPWSAIPTQAAVIIEVPDALSTWDQFTHTSQLWNAVEQVPGVAASGKLVAQLVAQLDTDEAFSNSLKNVPVLIAILRDGGEQIGSLFILAPQTPDKGSVCLLYTSDAADERSSVDLGGRRIIKKKNTKTKEKKLSIILERHTSTTTTKLNYPHVSSSTIQLTLRRTLVI